MAMVLVGRYQCGEVESEPLFYSSGGNVGRPDVFSVPGVPSPRGAQKRNLTMKGLAVSALLTLTINAAVVGQPSLSPEVLWWRDSEGTPRTATGLLYCPEVLAALASEKQPDSVPATITKAVNEQTPIVVMWTFPDGPLIKDITRPFHTRISDTTSGAVIQPLWEKQDAADLRVIDPERQFGNVGTMAAFPRAAFQRGGVVVLYAELPPDGTGRHRKVQVFGEFVGSRAPQTVRGSHRSLCTHRHLLLSDPETLDQRDHVRGTFLLTALVVAL